ncbi:MAG: 2-isopropylmalate synthase [Actinobacteria bacterium]|nr:2-isopropylmalate synthase [Actinomycetota bacterium]
MARKILIFDTTLRDGEQAPGIHLNVREKLEIVEQLDKLNVDTIEGGFPVSSRSDFNSIVEISKKIKSRYIAALARAVIKDIDIAGESLKGAAFPVIHTFISTSDIHLEYQFKKTRQEAVELAKAAVKRARNYTDRVEFSAMDATRSDRDFLCRMYEAAIKSGAKILNVPDTVGYALPAEFSNLIDYLFENVRGIENIILSVHCHNDLGLAVANSILAAQHGATQIEVAVNGIGERAGNAALEEVAMIIDTRKKDLGLCTDINLKEIIRTSSLVRHLTGYTVAPNKAIVGKSVFTHEAGIHQDGMLKHRTTYEIMKPEDIGSRASRLLLGKHSGRHAFSKRVEELGFTLKDEELQKAFNRFKDMAEKKGEISDDDLKAIINNEIREIEQYYKLKYYQVVSGSSIKATATVGIEIMGKLIESASYGDGPVDASFKAIDKITGMKAKLIDYNIEAVSEGKDAIGVVKIIVKSNGMEVMGSGISTDIIEASIKSYLDALNRIVILKSNHILKEP